MPRSVRRSHRRSPRRSKKRSPAKKSPTKKRSKARSKTRSPIRIHLTKGSLGKYGYTNVANETAVVRRKALAAALAHEDPLPIFKKLNALMVLNKNKRPQLSALFEADRNWVRDKYMY